MGTRARCNVVKANAEKAPWWRAPVDAQNAMNLPTLEIERALDAGVGEVS